MPKPLAMSIRITLGGLVALALLPLAGPASAQSSPRSPAPSAEQLMKGAIAAGEARASVRYNEVASTGTVTETFTTVAGTNSGEQVVSVRAEGFKGQLSVRLVHNVAYVKGGAFALSAVMGFKTTAALQEANRWLYLVSTSAIYPAVAYGLTVKSYVSGLKMSGPLTVVPETRRQGLRVYGVKAVDPASKMTVVMYVRALGAPLPVELTASSKAFSLSAAIGYWNEPVVVHKPIGAIPLLATWVTAG